MASKIKPSSETLSIEALGLEKLFKLRLVVARFPAPNSGTPACPICGNTMVLRTAKKGANAGNAFWGCSTFPRCRGIRDTNAQLRTEVHSRTTK